MGLGMGAGDEARHGTGVGMRQYLRIGLTWD